MLHLSWLNSPLLKKLCIIHYCRTTPTTSTAYLSRKRKDIELAKQNGLSDALIDRLLLTQERLQSIANDVRHVISLADPVGKIIDGGTLDSGLKIERVRTPLGVIGTIYEARPNVTIDVASLCLKTGNAVILRGGKETQFSNKILIEVVQNALEQAGLPKFAVQAITDPNRELVMQLLKLDRYVDMIIPRGGSGLHELCKQHSTIPVIVGGVGVCHTFVEKVRIKIKRFLLLITPKPNVQAPVTHWKHC